MVSLPRRFAGIINRSGSFLLGLWLATNLGAAAFPELISTRTPGTPRKFSVTGSATAAQWSGDGRFVVFVSDAPDLVTNDFNRAFDVFRYDVSTEQTELVSLLPDQTSNRDTTAFDPQISHDGHWVSFTGSTPGSRGDQVFLRDMDTGVTRLVSTRGPAESPSGLSDLPTLIRDGTEVIFRSAATNLTTLQDTNLTYDLFRWDRASQSIQRLSPSGTGRTGRGGFPDYAASAQGERVVMRSDDPTTPVPPETNVTDLWIWSRDQPTAKRLALPLTVSYTAPITTYNFVLSPTGRYLAFRTLASTATPELGAVWWTDLETGVVHRISPGSPSQPWPRVDDDTGPVLSPDGRRLAVVAQATSVAPAQIFIWDPEAGLHTLSELVLTVPPLLEEPREARNLAFEPGGAGLYFMTTTPVPSAGVTLGGRLRLFRWEFATGNVRDVWPQRDFGGLEPNPIEFSPSGKLLAATSRTIVATPQQGLQPMELRLLDLQGNEQIRLGLPDSRAVQAQPVGAALSSRISADGNRVVFTSTAGDLVSGDTNYASDVFLHDRPSGKVSCLSVNLSGVPASGSSRLLQISTNGQRVLFWSNATDLVANDTNGFPDLFIRDTVLGRTELVSARNGSSEVSDSWIGQAEMTPDGRWVAFQAASDWLAPDLSGQQLRLFLRDTLTSQTQLVNSPREDVRPVRNQPALGGLTPHGRWVAFLEGGDSWIWDRDLNSLQQLTQTRREQEFLTSPDRAWLFSVSGANNYETFNFQLMTFVHRGGAYVPVSTNQIGGILGMRASGPYLFFQAYSGTIPNLPSTSRGSLRHLYRFDPQTGEIIPVDVAPTNRRATDRIRNFAVDAAGETVVFTSQASDLLGLVGDSRGQLLARDLRTGVTALVSRNPLTGAPMQGTALAMDLSPDGRWVTFSTSAEDLTADENHFGEDVFVCEVRSLLTEDDDEDGLPDAWERMQFGNLTQSATDDPDQDGQSNRAEFAARTNPNSDESVLRLRSELTPDGQLILRWASEIGVWYELETSDRLGNWQAVPEIPPVPGTGLERQLTLPVAETQVTFLRLGVR